MKTNQPNFNIMELNLFRIKSLIAKEWAERRKHYCMLALVYLGCMAILFSVDSLIYMSNVIDPFGKDVDPREEHITLMAVFLFFLATISRGSDMMNSCMGRQGTTSFLTLPASVGEKFLVKWLYTVPFTVLLFIACYFLANVVRYVILAAVNPDFETICITGFHETFYNYFIKFSFIPILCVQSFFMLGSTYWGKNSMLKTAGILLVLFGIMVIIATNIPVYNDLGTWDFRLIWPHSFVVATLTWIPAGLMLLTWWLVYRQMCEMEIAYTGIRRSSKFVIAVIGLFIIGSAALPWYAAHHFTWPNAYQHYSQKAVWYPLPAFRHLILEDSLAIYKEDTVIYEGYASGTLTTRTEIGSGIELDLGIIIDRPSAENTLKHGIKISPELYAYMKFQSKGDTLHVFFDYPAKEKMTLGDRSLRVLHVSANGCIIRTDSLLSLRNSMHTVPTLVNWRMETLSFDGRALRIENSQIKKLMLKADPTFFTSVPENPQQRKLRNSVVLFNTQVENLHEYEDFPVWWYVVDEASGAESVFFHGTRHSSFRQDGGKLYIRHAGWKESHGFPTHPVWDNIKTQCHIKEYNQ